MASDISLSTATRSNLLSLQKTTDLIGRTQDRLSTGKKVNSAIDDALSFFTSRNLNDRATDLTSIKSGIDEGIQVLSTTTDALTSVEDTLKQMKAIASSAKSTAATDTATRNKLSSQFNELRSQVDHLVNDASYNGINLIKGDSNDTTVKADTLTVKFSEQNAASPKRELTIAGIKSDASSLKLQSAASGTGAGAWGVSTSTHATNIDSAISQIDSALTTVRASAQTFGVNASMLQIRADFTDNLVNTLESGAANLVNADLNEESANMLSLQTRQSLGSIALSIAQQSEQSILRLF